MNIVLDFVKDYWAIIVLAICFLMLWVYNRQKAKKVAKDLILEAEEKAEEYALKTGKEKFAWVNEKGYELLPISVKLFVSKNAFNIIIQYVFDKLIDWAEEENKPKIGAKNDSLSG